MSPAPTNRLFRNNRDRTFTDVTVKGRFGALGLGAGRLYRRLTDGARRVEEVRSGGSYLSQNDLRLHFGLGAHKVSDLQVRPSGQTETWKAIKSNQIVRIEEGSGATTPITSPAA